MDGSRFLKEIKALNAEKQFSVNLLESAWFTFFDKRLVRMRRNYNRRYIEIWKKYMPVGDDVEVRLGIVWKDCCRRSAARIVIQLNILGPFTMVWLYWRCYKEELFEFAKSYSD